MLGHYGDRGSRNPKIKNVIDDCSDDISMTMYYLQSEH